MAEAISERADLELPQAPQPPRLPASPPLRGLVAREPRRAAGFDHPRLTGRM